MKIKLDNNVYAFSVPEGATAQVEVTSGEVAYSPGRNGPFRIERTLASGETHEFSAPGLLAAYEPAELELVYPQPTPVSEV